MILIPKLLMGKLRYRWARLYPEEHTVEPYSNQGANRYIKENIIYIFVYIMYIYYKYVIYINIFVRMAER